MGGRRPLHIGLCRSWYRAVRLFQCASAYLQEAFTLYAAGATGAIYIIHGLKGNGFPLFHPRISQSLGYGWGIYYVYCCYWLHDRLRSKYLCYWVKYGWLVSYNSLDFLRIME